MNRSIPTLAYAEAGEGKAVLLIPGLAGLASFWTAAMGELPRHFRAIAVDHPGFGGSPDTEVSVCAITREVVRLMDALGIRSCAVVGHSTGGLIAQALALDYPSRVNGLVLSSTWAESDRRFRDLFWLRKQVLQRCGPDAYSMLGQLLAYPANWYEEKHARGTGAAETQLNLNESDGLTLQRIDMLLTYSRRADLAKISVPTFCIGAADDQIVPFHHTQMLAREIRGATVAGLVGGHFTPITATVAYAERLSRFLESLHA